MAVAWPYATGPRHIGHVAGFGVPSDTSPGTTGCAETTSSWSAGRTSTGRRSWSRPTTKGTRRVRPRSATTSSSARTCGDLGLSYDLFTRTTTEEPRQVTRDIFRTLYEKGYIVEQATLGAFSASTGHTLPDRYIEGTCPICGYESAAATSATTAATSSTPTDLIEPRSRIDGTTPDFRETTHLFLDLPAFKERLTELDRVAGALADQRPAVLARGSSRS